MSTKPRRSTTSCCFSESRRLETSSSPAAEPIQDLGKAADALYERDSTNSSLVLKAMMKFLSRLKAMCPP